MTPSSVDAPPEAIAGLPDALAEWRRLAPLIARDGLIDDEHLSLLVAACVEWDRYLEARTKAYPRVGVTRGAPVINPWLAIQHDALAGYMRLRSELGLKPRPASAAPDRRVHRALQRLALVR